MRLFTIVIICAVGLAGVLFGYWLASPGRTSEIPVNDGHEGHGNASEAVPTTLVDESSESDWCAEHWVPESECTLCHPALIEKFTAEKNWCGEHNMPESHCRKCNPKLSFAQEPKSESEPTTIHSSGVSVYFPANETGCTNDKALIQFASSETAVRTGIMVQPVVESRSVNAIEAPAEIVFDETRVKALSTTVSVTVVRWLVNPGQHVTSGQALAELESPDVVEWLSDYLNARADWQVDSAKTIRAEELRKTTLISEAEWEDVRARALSSQSRLAGAEGKLRSAGMSSEEITKVAAKGEITARFALKASSNCTVIERRASLGELLHPGSTLAVVGDGSALWIEAHVRQQDVASFTLGDRVQFAADDHALAHADATIIWVADYLDPTTRTGLVRARIDHSTSNLTANIFGRMYASAAPRQSAVMVPKDAVQWEGCCNIVFVQEAENRFRPHKVTIARGDYDHYAVMSGVQSGDMVVTNGSFFLKTELLKDKLGVGCTGE